MPEIDRDRIPQQRGRPMAFVELSCAFWGDGTDHRSWHVKQSPAGWRVEVFDVAEEPIPVGTYPTAEEAKRQAGVAARRSPSAHGAATAQ